MSDTTVRIENLGKMFRIGGIRQKFPTLRDRMADAFAAPFKKAARLLKGHAYGAAGLNEIIWALTDISFEVKQGEVVGLIGRNGAGKSTLLKILSRITEPTKGFAEIRGRVGSLLEVGTGFHPELTGRDNVFLNGAILGMKREEIRRKFDEIVAFAEVERFIDTPVKHYSSGMSVRLAFAVAAHLEPEILIVDEVLAVGDARFQRKCLNKMEDVGQEGRTILFVSHNMPTITRLCSRAVLIDEGKVVEDGPSPKVVNTYLNAGAGAAAERRWPDPSKAPGGDVARLRAVRVVDTNGRVSESIDIREPFMIQMEYEVLKEGFVLLPHYRLFNQESINIFETFDQEPEWRRRPRPKGYYVATARVPGNYLAEGTLFISCHLITLDPSILQFSESQILAIQIVDSIEGNTARGDWTGKMGGAVRPLLEWKTTFYPDGSRPESPNGHIIPFN